MGDLGKAIDYYQRSLTEHRTADILTKLRNAEKEKITLERDAYLDPVKAEEAREEGNNLFKQADFAGAVKAYAEAIKRAPDDPRGYSNRAAALQKLMSLPEAVKDCDEAIKRDPKFMRAHIRKCQLFLAMREYNKCLDACNEATQADTDGKFAREIDEQSRKCMNAMYSNREGETEEETMERIQRDPELVSIISDPVMQSILQQAKSNPQALNEHMKNPMIKQKIQKLMAAGKLQIFYSAMGGLRLTSCRHHSCWLKQLRFGKMIPHLNSFWFFLSHQAVLFCSVISLVIVSRFVLRYPAG